MNKNKNFNTSSSKILLPNEIYVQMERLVRGNILDIGTREGLKLESILKYVDEEKISKVTVIEPSSAYEEAKVRFSHDKRFQVLKERIEDADFSANYFDTIIMFDVIEHLFTVDDVMKSITGLLKPNGVFICCTPNKWLYRVTTWLSLKKTDPTHVNEMSYKYFMKLMNTYFEKTRFSGTFPYMRLAKRFPVLFKIYPLLSFLLPSWMWLTVYCFATVPIKENN